MKILFILALFFTSTLSFAGRITEFSVSKNSYEVLVRGVEAKLSYLGTHCETMILDGQLRREVEWINQGQAQMASGGASGIQLMTTERVVIQGDDGQSIDYFVHGDYSNAILSINSEQLTTLEVLIGEAQKFCILEE